MDDLQAALEAADWPVALSTARSLGVAPSYVHKHHFLRDRDPAVLALVDDDPAWVATAVLSTPAFDSKPAKQAELVRVGLEATEKWVDELPGLAELLKQEGKRIGKEREGALQELSQLIGRDENVKAACEARWTMLDRGKRWRAYCEMYGLADALEAPASAPSDDPWDDPDGDGQADGWEPFDSASTLPADALPFSAFCDRSPEDLAMGFAASLELRQARILHSHFPAMDRLRIATGIPLHADPSESGSLVAILPRPTQPGLEPTPLLDAIYAPPAREQTAETVTQWYLDRVAAVDDQLGAVDLAMSLVQHGASLGVEGLEPLAEDLSLLSKLVYDARPPGAAAQWTLADWKAQNPAKIVASYLARSAPATLEKDLRRLVLPYLDTVAARLERGGSSADDVAASTPDLLREWTLATASKNLPLFAAFVKASSPSRKATDRILRDDTQLARLALAVLYTSRDQDSWESMSAVFECMPAFDDASPPPADFSARATLRELLKSISVPDAGRLYAALSAFSPGELGGMLDTLDDDLAAAEVLARWNVPVPLPDLVGRLAGDRKEQAKLALRMARQDGGANVESEDEWMALMEAMAGAAEKGKVFELLGRQEAVKIFFGGLLSSGKFRLAKSLFSPSTGHRPLDPDVQEELVLDASREFYENAESGNQNVGEMKLALECLSAAPQTVAVRQERDFIEATSRLTSFRLQSEPGLAISPLQIRLTKDKLVLIAKLLETSEDVYRHPDMILDLVSKLGMRDRLSEVRALALVTDAALRVRDAERAMDICDRMVQTVHALRKSPGAGAGGKEEQAAAAAEVAWRTCAQLGTGPTGTKEVRLKLLGHALILCPATEMAPLLANWRIVDQLAPTDPAARLAGPSAPLVGAKFAVPGQLGGVSGRPQSPLVESTSDAAARAARTFGRAAALFPFGHHRARSSTPSDRAGSASTGGLKLQTPTSQHPNVLASPPSSAGDAGSPLGSESHADRLTAALSNRFTSGVGWLIGAEGV